MAIKVVVSQSASQVVVSSQSGSGEVSVQTVSSIVQETDGVRTAQVIINGVHQQSESSTPRSGRRGGARGQRPSDPGRGRGRRTGRSTQAPCLYAIALAPNPKRAEIYVGKSEFHTAECKFAIHTRGVCVCGRVAQPNPYQRSSVAKKWGQRLLKAKPTPGVRGNALTRAEEAWAAELAVQHGCRVWCNGKAFEP